MKIDEIIEVVDKIKELRRTKDKHIRSLELLQVKIKRFIEKKSAIHIEICYENFQDSINFTDFEYYNSSRIRIAILSDLQLEVEQLCESIKECDEEIEKLSKLIET